MTDVIDVAVLTDESPGTAVPGPAEGDGGRRDDGGENAGGGHTGKAGREGKLDVRNSWQVVAGSILIPLGVVLIMISWYGAAHARVVQQQIPYLVSGSFVGLGCMVVGGLCYWGHWLYRIYDQADLHHQEQQRMLEVIAAALTGRDAARGLVYKDEGEGAGAWSESGSEGGEDGGTYFATPSGSVYHRADCVVIAHHPEDLRVLGPNGVAGMRPCQICLPEPSE